MNVRRKMYSINTLISVILITLFILMNILSYTIFSDTSETKLLFRMMARGIFGLALIYNSIYLLITDKQSFLVRNSTPMQRKLCGTLIGLVGIGMVLTALLGYGINGDPRFIWWK
jgi:tryptophan-rich sensory protein